jgi:hypothetical protein
LSFYECRTALAWRLLFVAQKGIVTLDFDRDHDEVTNDFAVAIGYLMIVTVPKGGRTVRNTTVPGYERLGGSA